VETVATFDTIIDANIAMGRLKSEGVDCWLADEHLVQTDMLYSPAIGGIKLQVAKQDADTARKILATDYSDLHLPGESDE
jgi:hypothetical protein